jgi:asparagine synthase (glutamine-hydrolysing)
VDSSAVVAEMAALGGKVKTFCIGYDSGGSYYDERKYAAMVAQQFGTEHAEFVVQPDVLDVIPKLVDAFDQPFADSSAIANYYVFQETRKHVKVVLSGLGGDEVAAGYERYAGLRMLQQWRALPKWLRGGVIGGIANALPDPKSGNRIVERIKRFVRNGTLDDANAYLGYVSAFDAARRKELWTTSAAQRLNGHDAASYITDRFNDPAASDPVNKALYTDTLTYLTGDLLTLTDRMSMLASVEGRAPFVDHELVEFMGRVPPELKLKGNSNKKYLLKKAFEGTLPHEILYRAKRGFTVPLTVWFRNELNPMVRETLSRARIEKLGLFNWQYVQRIVDEHTSAKENHHSRIWALLMFMQWHERYIGH